MGANVICISRAIWVGAEAIATDVARELGYRCVDEEIINLAADRRKVNPSMVADAERRKSYLTQLLEDISRGGVSELINYIPGQRTLPVASDDARVLIRDAILETANQGQVVIVAHAASYALSRRSDVLRVLVTGSPFAREGRWVLANGGKGPREASEAIESSDKARAHYLKRFYDVDHESADDYDLTISTDKVSPEVATRLIVQAAREMEVKEQPVPVSSGWDLPATPKRPNRVAPE